MILNIINSRIYLLLSLFVFILAATPYVALASKSSIGYSIGEYAGDFVKEKNSGRVWYIDTKTSRRYQITANDDLLFERLRDLAVKQSWPRISAVPEVATKITISAGARINILGVVYDENAPDLLWHIQKRAYKRQALKSSKDILSYVENAIEVSDSKKLLEYPIGYSDFEYIIEDPVKGMEYPKDMFSTSTAGIGKQITVNLKQQRLRAYENGRLVNTFLISSGKGKFGTKKGLFSVLAKVPVVNYMWTYAPGDPNNYDLGNVPYNLRIYPHTYIHYAYWHNNFGHPMSHGCVNMNLANIKWVYRWADEGIPVLVY